jgi:hypothetical protein
MAGQGYRSAAATDRRTTRRPSIIAAPAVVVVACAGMIVVELSVESSKGAMIRPVLTPAVKAFLVSAFVGPTDTPMELAVPDMVAGM